MIHFHVNIFVVKLKNFPNLVGLDKFYYGSTDGIVRTWDCHTSQCDNVLKLVMRSNKELFFIEELQDREEILESSQLSQDSLINDQRH